MSQHRSWRTWLFGGNRENSLLSRFSKIVIVLAFLAFFIPIWRNEPALALHYAALAAVIAGCVVAVFKTMAWSQRRIHECFYGKKPRPKPGGNFGKTNLAEFDPSIQAAFSARFENLEPSAAVFFEALARKKADAPLIGMQIGGQEINQRLVDALKDSRGVHIETLLGVLGSLAGYACRATVSITKVASELQQRNGLAFVEVTGADGKTYFMGDLINRPLLQNQYSVWSIAAGAAKSLGCSQFLDLDELVRWVAGTLGGAQFGIPRIPDGHRPSDVPINYVAGFWTALLPIAARFCDGPEDLPVLYGMAIQEAMKLGKDLLEPGLALRIAMEHAVPMSKIGPNHFAST